MTDRTRRIAWIVAVSLVVPVAGARAQAWNYPAFQQPRVVSREFNFAVFTSGDGGTGLLAQWRESVAPDFQIELEGGFVSPDHIDTHGLLGASLGYQLFRATHDVPLDFVLTGGLFDAFGSPNVFRVPFGLSVGHQFAIQNSAMTITPFGEPRLSIDHVGGDFSSTKVGVEFDLGVNIQFTQQLATRVMGTFGGPSNMPNDPGFGLSVAWTPLGLLGARR